MSASEIIHIVFACDDAYAQHAGIAIISLREQQRSGLPVHVHLLDGGISTKNLERLYQLKDRHLDITIYNGHVEEYSQYLVLEHFSRSMYLRLSVENIIPQNINRILYCDCDVIFLKPIDALWNINLEGFLLAAVAEGWSKGPNYWRKDLGIHEPGSYFCSGVLLIDLDSWRKNQICGQVKNYIKSNLNIIQFPDQDGLNAVLYKKYLPIDKTWNFFSSSIGRKEEFSPHIVHFATQFKPWYYKSVDIFQDEYLKYLFQSPWKDYKFPDKNIFIWLKRKILLLAPKPLIRVLTLITYSWRRTINYLARLLALAKIKNRV